MKIAIMVDGGFFRRRVRRILKNSVKLSDLPSNEEIETDAKRCAYVLEQYCKAHLKMSRSWDCGNNTTYLYRIFYYDCPPLGGNVYHPLTKRTINFSKSTVYKWTNAFFNALKCKRKFALRLGKLCSKQEFVLKQSAIKELLNGRKTKDDLTEGDFEFSAQQKGVDMRIGLDIASLSYKKLVDQIILISGDSDFVPASKLARREGIDFILDAMNMGIEDDLNEHIDGLRSPGGKFKIKD